MGRHRDVVVVGASAGGIEALTTLFAMLPRDLDAAVLCVLHLSDRATSHLPDILGRRAALPLGWARHDEEIGNGRIHLAPPDRHLLLEGRRMILGDGTRENHARPAINRLFRSAAAHHDSRVVGVVLTGMLDDGAAGAVAIQRCGGAVLVQDPEDAAFGSMPASVIRALRPDAVLPLPELPAAIAAKVAEEVAPAPVPPEIATEAELDRTGRIDVGALGRLGAQSPLSCPECGGPTWTLGSRHAPSYRCYLGHATSVETMLALKSEEIEHALWAGLRALEERAATYRHLSADATELGSAGTATQYDERAARTEAHVTTVRELIESLPARDRAR